MLGFVVPTIIHVHNQLELLIEDEGDEVKLNTFLSIIADSAKANFLLFGDKVARIATQTGIAYLLLRAGKTYTDTIVFVWDLYPRLHQHHVREALEVVKLPQALTTLCGPQTGAADIKFFALPISPAAAMEDCMKRVIVEMTANVVVDALTMIPPHPAAVRSSFKRDRYWFLEKFTLRVSDLVMRSLGAAAGRAVGGPRGEYWGEVLGMLLAPALHIQFTTSLIRRPRRDRVSRREGAERGRSQSRSHSADRERSRSGSRRSTSERSSRRQ
uniref:Uncharacterized protein n=1 Tax=Trypanosoma vivax (strain Y486) TaxID=1055687 RepID=G0TZ57_TRYVY|nr:conserved hypothetical protein [Trypanosoma vivax Y486]